MDICTRAKAVEQKDLNFICMNQMGFHPPVLCAFWSIASEKGDENGKTLDHLIHKNASLEWYLTCASQKV